MLNTNSELLQNYIKLNNASGINSNVAINRFAVNPYMQYPAMPQMLQNDTVEIANKNKSKTKKQKIAKIALLGATVGAVAIGAFAILRGKANIVKDTGELIGKAKTEAQKLGKYENGLNNVTNIRDSFTRKILIKIPGYEKFDNACSDLYRKILTKTISGSHKRAGSAILNADKGILEAIKTSKLEESKAQRLKTLLEKRANAVREFMNPDSISNRFSKVNGSLDRLDLDAVKKVSGVANKENINAAREFTTTSVVQSRLQKAKELQNSLLSKYKNTGLTQDELKEFNSLVESLGNKDIQNSVSKADKIFNGAFKKESKDMFNKLRDINCGSAPTDILGIGLTAGALGVYVAQADTKEEKVGVTLTTGIPLLTALGTLVFAATKMVSGGRAMGLATTTGFVSKLIGDNVNKIYQKKHNTENIPRTIVTYDDYVNSAREFQQNLITR